ncbi:hypothetical protein [Pseudoxanthomonas japonensis]|uniref:hypothetical protein n=1 Tax=Pseudoxanthomonas japonensis TaxID=69284 RepID=UPI001BCF3029|nr:hypothetical protein [Pseudoxanthomonas japonensis]
MLTTIIKGKAGRVHLPGSDASLSWREVFRRNEDLLTGVVFGRFRYLSREALTAVMDCLLDGRASIKLGELQAIELWPRLERLEGRSFVEPDVLLTFQDAAVLIEVKPPYGGDQYVGQWKAEIEALAAEYRAKARDALSTVHFVALGRNLRALRSGEIEKLRDELYGEFSLTIQCREWEDLIEFVSAPQSVGVASDGAVFDDWMQAFDLFGLVQKASPAAMWRSLIGWSANRAVSLGLLAAWPDRSRDGLVPHASASVSLTKHAVDWAKLIEFSKKHPLRGTYESK